MLVKEFMFHRKTAHKIIPAYKTFVYALTLGLYRFVNEITLVKNFIFLPKNHLTASTND
jgi:hypothetical protein